MTFIPGQTPTDETGTRDAFHVQGVVVMSSVPLSPGQDVCLTSEGSVAILPKGNPRHGIVDPYLTGVVAPYTPFLVFMDPARVGVVRHTFDIDGVNDEEAEDDYDDGCRSC